MYICREQFVGGVAVELLRFSLIEECVDVSKCRCAIERPKPLSQPLPEQHGIGSSHSSSRLSYA